jgi:hypothetical protein
MDYAGDWYSNLGDGRVQGTVASLDELDAETLTICDYQVVYRAEYGNDPCMNSGWIINNIHCSGYDDNGPHHHLIVHETDPRYMNNPDWAVWGTWEYHVLTESSVGNLLRPEHHVPPYPHQAGPNATPLVAGRQPSVRRSATEPGLLPWGRKLP